MNILHTNGFRGLVLGLSLATFIGCTSSLWTPWHRGPHVTDPLGTLRTSDLPNERSQAIELLGDAKDSIKNEEAAVAALVNSLEKETNVFLRAKTYRTLAKFRTKEAAQAIDRGLEDAAAEVRLACVDGVAIRGTETAGRQLCTLLGSDTDLDVRIAASNHLAQYQGEHVRQALFAALDDRNPAVQRSVMQSLGQITGETYGNDVAAWRAFAENRKPEARSENVAQRVRGWFYSF